MGSECIGDAQLKSHGFATDKTASGKFPNSWANLLYSPLTLGNSPDHGSLD